MEVKLDLAAEDWCIIFTLRDNVRNNGTLMENWMVSQLALYYPFSEGLLLQHFRNWIHSFAPYQPHQETKAMEKQIMDFLQNLPSPISTAPSSKPEPHLN